MIPLNIPSGQYPRPYWPQELTDEGYVGKLKIFVGFCALVIPKPQASAKDIARSLQNIAEQFKWRAEIEGGEERMAGASK